ncbi:olfactory receptor 10A7-like [Chelonoidis abingdonii]|uniref:olfactory receptor 10A7-like n=1 Tax=Chelonoidis abingdonii TaxID=106734 RepID=UPI0013F26010|nr:olfactory receptor 10A7-like [Chelonoidis abingdonii]
MTEFILQGFSDLQTLPGILLFVVVLVMYTVTMMGNSLNITLILAYPLLHTPMYFFLSNLSFLEICYTSVTTPKMLVNLLVELRTISYSGCIAQMCFFSLLGTAECLLLAAMAYDRFMAICHPLCYVFAMNRRVCGCLVAGSWLGGVAVALIQTALIAKVPFCGSNAIDHFFCDIVPLIQLACGDTSVNWTELLAVATFVVIIPFGMILVSYICIISTILRMPSAEGRGKAFSTCSSHLMGVFLFYGTCCMMYLSPTSSNSLGIDKLFALLYTMVTPMLNPIIYCLRNKEVKGALRNFLGRTKCAPQL